MYELYYKFTAEPFRLSPDHRFCFEHKSYGKARAYMAYAYKRAEGFVMITGRPGTGKTTLIGELVESLARDRVVTANLVCTQLQADDLLKTVAYNFGISPAQVGKAELLQQLNVLLHRWHREGRRALLVVDEAQDLSASAMEELRLLTNIQFGGQPLLQIFLLGQPELRDLILSPQMEQVHQRIVAASHIEGLEESETEAYVIHRLSVVGWRGNPAIDRAIFPLIHKFSEGVPRRINLICSRLFLLGSVEERDVIGVADVRVVIGELQAENLAAGTGISQSDFITSAEPQWVPVPVHESPVAPLAPLQAVPSPSFVAADVRPTDQQPPEPKKKDIPRLEPVAKAVPDSDSGIPSLSVAHFEFVPEADPVTQAPPPTNDPVAVENRPAVVHDEGKRLVDRPLVPRDDENLLVTAGGGVAGPNAIPRRRFFVLGFLVIAAIALVLLLKSCFEARESLAVHEPGQRELVADGQTVVGSMAGSEQAGKTSQAVGLSDPATGEPVNPSELVDAELNAAAVDDGAEVSPRPERAPKLSGSVAVPANSASQQDLEPILVTAKPRSMPQVSATTAADVVPVSDETAVTQARSKTILISFPFDSDALIPGSHLALDRAATLLREDATSKAAITGFTDNRGDSQYNLILSRKRADAVEQYLVAAGIARERLHVEGRGALTNPVEGQGSDDEASTELYRVVQIKLGNDG